MKIEEFDLPKFTLFAIKEFEEESHIFIFHVCGYQTSRLSFLFFPHASAFLFIGQWSLALV